jgi:FkbM family methyltransferase
MAANSISRRVIKKLLAPMLDERAYRVLQGIAMGWDIRSGAWTEPELDLIALATRVGETAIDIGANYGLYSYHLSRALGPTGKVYAFEPVPFTSSTFRFIARALRFQNVELIDKGCGDKAGQLTFTVPISDTGAIMAGQVHAAARNDERSGKEKHARFVTTKEVTCDVVALDDYLPGIKDVSFLKCDIEGADYYALLGAKRIIEENHPTIVVEINPWFLEGFGIHLDQLLGFLGERGYAMYRYQNKRLVPTPADQVVEDNYVFVHASRRARLASVLPASA